MLSTGSGCGPKTGCQTDNSFDNPSPLVNHMFICFVSIPYHFEHVNKCPSVEINIVYQLSFVSHN